MRLLVLQTLQHILTRKPSYRKDDRAMRPIYGCGENFPQSVSTPTATFPELVRLLALQTLQHILTRKPSYRKHDRVMRPIYGCRENF